MRLLKRRKRRVVACIVCNGTGWRYVPWGTGEYAESLTYARCPDCGGSGDFVSRRDT